MDFRHPVGTYKRRLAPTGTTPLATTRSATLVAAVGFNTRQTVRIQTPHHSQETMDSGWASWMDEFHERTEAGEENERLREIIKH